MNTLTQLILKEVMLSPDKKTEELALKAMGHVAKCLAKPVCGLSSSCASLCFTFVGFPDKWQTGFSKPVNQKKIATNSDWNIRTFVNRFHYLN